MSRMTFNEAAKRRMLQGDIGLVQGERGIAVKYDNLAFKIEHKNGVPKLVVGMFSGKILVNEVEESIEKITSGHTLFITGFEGHMYLSNDDIMGLTK